jgi:KDO2-lipid IV(A) lauroyltransferase
MKFNVPLFPVFMVRSPEDPTRHTIYVEPALSFELTGDRDADIRLITQLFTDAIEKYVRKFPDQWMWFHRRWKTKPRAENQ